MNRVKLIRNSLNLSQKDFGNTLGLKANTISSIETGKNILTEQNIKMICSTFQISETWLRTGNGNMFAETSEIDDFSKIISDIVKSDDEFVKRFLLTYWSLSKENRTIISKFMDMLAKAKDN